MRVTLHPTADDLLHNVRPFLEANEVENGLLLGICAKPPAPIEIPALWISIDAASDPVAVAVRTPPFRLVLSRAPHDAMDALVTRLDAAAYPLPGVIGPSDTARAFADRWALVRGVRTEVTMRQGIYELTKVTSPSPVAPGTLRRAGAKDVARVAEWMGSFATDAGLPVDEREAFRRHAGTLVESGVFFWMNSGEAVSMAASKGLHRMACGSRWCTRLDHGVAADTPRHVSPP